VTDAVVVGSGPNGLAAAIQLARAGLRPTVLEAADEPGGGCRSAELTLPGLVHDVCSAVHPLAVASPFFRELRAHGAGVEWVHPPAPLAHPLDDGSAVLLHRSLNETADALGPDGDAYRTVVRPLTDRWEAIVDDVLGDYRRPHHPIALARFARHGVRSVAAIARGFREPRVPALLAGMAAHAARPLDGAATAGVALAFAVLAHTVGWPVARGGSGRIVYALIERLRALGGEVVTGTRVGSLDELPTAKAVLLDLTPREAVRVAGERLPSAYRQRLETFAYGPGVFKVDWALDGPVPWRAEGCALAGTVHVGGTFEEIADAESAVQRGDHPERPFVILAQQSLFDATRSSDGRQALWAYCHVPNGSDADMTKRIESQIERFAPGFRDRVLARHVAGPAELERANANYAGGDIGGGIQGLRRLFAGPAPRLDPYSTPVRGLFLCSSSTPPGPGVHGMCGVHAARSALRSLG